MTGEQRFIDELPLIERVIGSICRRRALGEDEAEDFASWVRVRLIDKDYAIVAKFQERSRFSTFMTTVIQHLFLDYRIAKWGKWRPSAKAKRLGREAVELERLIHRDGHAASEAVEVLWHNHRGQLAREDLERLVAEVPSRERRRFVGDAELEHLEAPGSSAERASRSAVEPFAEATGNALGRALAELTARDRLVLKMHFQEGFTIADIARTLRLDAKALYPRIEQCKRQLRGFLEAEGITNERVAEVLEWDFDLGIHFGPGPESESPGPSQQLGARPEGR